MNKKKMVYVGTKKLFRSQKTHPLGCVYVLAQLVLYKYGWAGEVELVNGMTIFG